MLVKELCIGHAHKNQVVDASRFGRIDGRTALRKLQINALLGCSKEVGDDEHFFGPCFCKSLLQVCPQGVVTNDRFDALTRQRVAGRTGGAKHLETCLHQSSAYLPTHLAGGVEYENFFERLGGRYGLRSG